MKIIITALAALSLLSPAAHADQYMGIGSANCRTIMSFYDNQASAKLMSSFAEQWITGFFSGINLAVSDEEMRDITDEAVSKVEPDIKAFCKAHPDNNPFTIAVRAWKALPISKK